MNTLIHLYHLVVLIQIALVISNVNNRVAKESCNKITAVANKFSSVVENTSIESKLEMQHSSEESMESTNCHQEGQGSDQEYIQDNDQSSQDEDPDWEVISLHEPAKSDVPIFLSARNSRNDAHLRFGAALDECHASLKNSMDELLSTAASIHHVQSEKLDALEMEIKHLLVENEDRRATMQQKLQESATAAHGLFTELLMKVSQPLKMTCAQIHASNKETDLKDLSSGKRSLDVGEKRINKRKKPLISEKIGK